MTGGRLPLLAADAVVEVISFFFFSSWYVYRYGYRDEYR